MSAATPNRKGPNHETSQAKSAPQEKPNRHPNTREQECKPGECPPGGSKQTKVPKHPKRNRNPAQKNHQKGGMHSASASLRKKSTTRPQREPHTSTSNQRQPHPGTEKGTSTKKGASATRTLKQQQHQPNRRHSSQRAGVARKQKRKEHPAEIYICHGNNHPGKPIKLCH